MCSGAAISCTRGAARQRGQWTRRGTIRNNGARRCVAVGSERGRGCWGGGWCCESCQQQRSEVHSAVRVRVRVRVQLGCGGVRAGAAGTGRVRAGAGAGAGGAAAVAGGTGVSDGAEQAALIDGWRVGAGCVYGRCTKTPPTATAPNNHSQTCLALRREAGGGRLQPVSRALALPVPVPALTSQPLAPAAPLAAAYTRMLRGAGGRGWVVLWCREHATCTYQTQARVAALSRNKAEQSVNAKSDNLEKQTAERAGEGVEREKGGGLARAFSRVR